jgi:hypothetical protein
VSSFLSICPSKAGSILSLVETKLENRLERLGFCAKTHGLMERFKSQFRVIGDVESNLRRAGFGLVRHTDFQCGGLP